MITPRYIRENLQLVCGQTIKLSTLPLETSSFSSVAHAINIALDILSEIIENNFIFSDSLSVVRILKVKSSWRGLPQRRIESGQLSTTCSNATKVVQWDTPSCIRPQPATDRGVRD